MKPEKLRYRHRRLSDSLEYALLNWGKWRSAPVSGLNLPSIAQESREALSPGRCTKPNQGPKLQFAKPEVREVEHVYHLWCDQQRGQLALALWCCWVQNWEYERSCHALGVTWDQYGRTLQQAHESLAATLGMKCYHERRKNGWAKIFNWTPKNI